MNEKPDSFEFVMWSSAKHLTIEALVNEYNRGDFGLDVWLYQEYNAVDAEAVAVICKLADDHQQNSQILGGKSSWISHYEERLIYDDGWISQHEEQEVRTYLGQIIGYVSRKDRNKSALARDQFETLPVRAHLVRRGINDFIIEPCWTMTEVLPDDGVPF